MGVYTNVNVICRPTQKEAIEYYRYVLEENADWEAGFMIEAPAQEAEVHISYGVFIRVSNAMRSLTGMDASERTASLISFARDESTRPVTRASNLLTT